MTDFMESLTAKGRRFYYLALGDQWLVFHVGLGDEVDDLLDVKGDERTYLRRRPGAVAVCDSKAWARALVELLNGTD